MNEARPIPATWSTRWRQLRTRVLPASGLVVCVAIVCYLWNQHGQLPNAVGQVEAVRLDIVAVNDGLLLPLESAPQGTWRLLDPVRKGQIVARLDDRAALAAVESLRSQVASLRKELKSTQEEIRLDHFDRRHEYLREASSLACQVEKYRLDILDRKVEIEADEVAMQRFQARLDLLAAAKVKGAVPEIQILEVRTESDAIARRIERNKVVLAELEKAAAAATARQTSFPDLEQPDMASLLAPLQASIAAQEALVRELEAGIDSLEIRAPVSGTICAIYYQPGQHVRAGEPILAVMGEDPRYIISYLRQEQRSLAQPGAAVEVRVRSVGSRPVATTVEEIGEHFEILPVHLLRDPKVLELGLPVRLTYPSGLGARPGEVVDISFRPRQREDRLADAEL